MSYLDTGLASTYFSETDQLVVPPSGSPNSLSQTQSATPQRPTRRYKTQLRDFLSTCRPKRKLTQTQQNQHQANSNMGQVIYTFNFCSSFCFGNKLNSFFSRLHHQIRLLNIYQIQLLQLQLLTQI